MNSRKIREKSEIMLLLLALPAMLLEFMSEYENLARLKSGRKQDKNDDICWSWNRERGIPPEEAREH